MRIVMKNLLFIFVALGFCACGSLTPNDGVASKEGLAVLSGVSGDSRNDAEQRVTALNVPDGYMIVWTDDRLNQFRGVSE